MTWTSFTTFLCLVSVTVGGPRNQHFIVEPQDKTALAGRGTTLTCKVGNKQGKCQWTKDGFGLGTKSDLPGFPRFAMQGGATACHLEIHPVLPEDDGEYQCQVGAVAGAAAISSGTVRLRVIAEPGQPYILQGASTSTVQVKLGEQVSLQCESQGSRPPAHLDWVDGRTGDRVLGPVDEAVTKIKDSQTFKTTSVLKLTPTEDMLISCSATSDEFPTAKHSRNLEIKIRHKPNTDIDISRDVIKEGDSFEVVCKCDSFPEEVAYKWFFSGRELKGQINSTLIIEEISRMYDQSDIKCTVENEEGQSEASTRLNVEFPPTILQHPKSQIAQRNEKVTFHCVAEGNPQPVYLWTKGGPAANILAGYRQNLTLVATEKTESVYICKVFSDGYEIVSSMPASLTLIRRPVVVVETVKYGVIGQDAILQCTTHSVSNKTMIVWTKNDQPLEVAENRLKIKVVNNNIPGKQQSDLLIRSLTEEDFSEYGCFASNEVGTDYRVIGLKTEGPVDLSYFVGIPSVIGLLIIILVIVYCRCCKKYAPLEQKY